MKKEYVEPAMICEMFHSENIVTSSGDSPYTNKLRREMNVSEGGLTEVIFGDLIF